MEKKICTMCRQELPLDSFYKIKRASGSYQLINDAQNEAAAHGMTYGQWEAQQYMKRLKEGGAK